jgi:hypothetical protein
MDPFAVAYVSGAATLVAAEFYAIFRRRGKGDTITEKVKGSRPLHAIMSSLLVWGVWHFIGSDLTGRDDVATNVAVAIGGGVLGVSAHAKPSATRGR